MAASPQVEHVRGWKNPRIVGRITEVDGLRGAAILLVLCFHYVTAIGAPSHPLWALVTRSTSLFWSGVDLFFVLSGFLIAGILLDSVQSRHYFKTFYLRRMHRIFPLYFGWLTLFYLGFYFNWDSTLGAHLFQTQVPLWFYPLFLQNNAPLWFNVEGPLWMAMSWSLAVEEQFYIVLPALIRIANRTVLVLLCIATLLLSPIYRFALVATHPQLNVGWPFSTFTRLDGLAAGVAIALVIRNEECWIWLKRHGPALRVCSAILLVGFAWLTLRAPAERLMALCGFTIIAAFYAALLLMAICQPGSFLSSILAAPILRYFGRISYAVYIFHQGVHGIVYSLFPAVWPPPFNALRMIAITILALAATILLAEITWRLVESKLIRRAHAQYSY